MVTLAPLGESGQLVLRSTNLTFYLKMAPRKPLLKESYKESRLKFTTSNVGDTENVEKTICNFYVRVTPVEGSQTYEV